MNTLEGEAHPKLSIKQKEVIQLMKQGWELGQLNASTPLPKRYWLQEGGLRKGGKTKNIRETTVYSLIRLGLLTPIILRQSSLTPKGENIIL